MDHKRRSTCRWGMTAEVVAERYKVSREAQDEYALASQQRTAAAQQAGKFKDEIVPDEGDHGGHRQGDGRRSRRRRSTVDQRRVQPSRHDARGARRSCRRAFNGERHASRPATPRSSPTAPRPTLIMSADRAKELGIKPLGFFRGCVFAGCEPDEMGIGPVFAVPKLLKRAGLKIDDIDIVELNEAFASQVGLLPRPARHRPGEAQPERRLDLDRPPVRHDRRAHDRHAALELRRAEEALGHRHDVHRRRHGRRRAVRGRELAL